MSVAANVVIALVVLIFVIGIGVAFWKSKRAIEFFAHHMFSGKQAEQGHRSRQAASAEEAYPFGEAGRSYKHLSGAITGSLRLWVRSVFCTSARNLRLRVLTYRFPSPPRSRSRSMGRRFPHPPISDSLALLFSQLFLGRPTVLVIGAPKLLTSDTTDMSPTHTPATR